MSPRRLAPVSFLCGVLLLLTGCAQTDSQRAPQLAASATQSSDVEAPSRAALEGIPLEEMTDQPVPVQMTQCLTQHAQWIDLPAGTTSSDLYTRISAHEQELLFLLPDELGGFDNVDVAAGQDPRGSVSVFIVGSASGEDDAAAAWQALREASPEVDAAAAGIEAEGASFTPELVEFSYAELCTTQLAAFALPLWTNPGLGLQSVRMDVEANRVIAGVASELITADGIDEIVATGPDGIYDFEEIQ